VDKTAQSRVEESRSNGMSQIAADLGLPRMRIVDRVGGKTVNFPFLLQHTKAAGYYGVSSFTRCFSRAIQGTL